MTCRACGVEVTPENRFERLFMCKPCGKVYKRDSERRRRARIKDGLARRCHLCPKLLSERNVSGYCRGHAKSNMSRVEPIEPKPLASADILTGGRWVTRRNAHGWLVQVWERVA